MRFSSQLGRITMLLSSMRGFQDGEDKRRRLKDVSWQDVRVDGGVSSMFEGSRILGAETGPATRLIKRNVVACRLLLCLGYDSCSKA